MSEQPYKLGNGATVGGTVAKAGAEIGTAISEGVQAVAGVKKHRNALQHIAEQNQLGHERMIHAMSHAESLAAKAKADGRNTRVSATHNSIDYKSEAINEPKNKKKKGGSSESSPPKQPPVKSSQLALAPGNPPRSALPQGNGPTKPSSGSSGSAPTKPETMPANATVKPMLALPPGKSDTAKMRDFNANKKSRGITGGSKVNATSVRTRIAKNAANPKIYPAGVKSTPEQVKVGVATAWRDKKKTMQAAKKDTK